MIMNHWTDLSFQMDNQRNYLDLLFRVYPTIPEDLREINDDAWQRIENSFNSRNNMQLLRGLLEFGLFPIKDSYVAYLRRDQAAVERNPETVNRLCCRLYDMGLNNIFERCSQPKETNRQIGPLFKRWLESGALGVPMLNQRDFLQTRQNAVLRGSDQELKDFARQHLRYARDKGLDIVAKFNGKYVIGEAKFLTDFGGHQNAQFNDAIDTLQDTHTQQRLRLPFWMGSFIFHHIIKCVGILQITQKSII